MSEYRDRLAARQAEKAWIESNVRERERVRRRRQRRIRWVELGITLLFLLAAYLLLMVPR